MAGRALADTGAIVALLDRTDRWHLACTTAFDSLRLPLITSEAVLTELFYLVSEDDSANAAAWRFVRSGAIELATITNDELPAIHALMSKYHDRPMDFADATLVHLATRLSIDTAFTIDHADFRTYRIGGRRSFRVVPERKI